MAGPGSGGDLSGTARGRPCVRRPGPVPRLSRAIVAASEDVAREQRLDALRLDCWAGNETHKGFYLGQGFQGVAEVTSEGHRICLFEKSLRGSARV